MVLIIHTDQGGQYRASDYRKLLWKHGISCSMSAKGCCWDNAVVESFFSTLKIELDLDDDAKTLLNPAQIQRSLAFWIEGYYNRERRHSTFGFLSPINDELCLATTTTIIPVKPLDLSSKSGELHIGSRTRESRLSWSSVLEDPLRDKELHGPLDASVVLGRERPAGSGSRNRPIKS